MAYELKARLLDEYYTAKGNMVIPVQIDKDSKADAQKCVDELRDKDTNVAISTFRKKRSLSANNYSWVLTDKLSDFMVIRGVKLSKEEMHAEMIFRYGQPRKDEDEKDVFISALSHINVQDFYPYAKEVGDGEADGKQFTHYKIFRGSSEYNSKEMSTFIAGIVEECKDLGIQTETPDEIAKMLARMGDVDAQ